MTKKIDIFNSYRKQMLSVLNKADISDKESTNIILIFNSLKNTVCNTSKEAEIEESLKDVLHLIREDTLIVNPERLRYLNWLDNTEYTVKTIKKSAKLVNIDMTKPRPTPDPVGYNVLK